jgi:hypothetical protein
MTDEAGVASETAEENKGILDLGEIAKAAGVIIESAEEESAEVEETTEEESTETQIEETEEPQDIETTEYSGDQYEEEEPEPEQEETQQEDSAGVKKRIGKLIEARNKAEEELQELKQRVEELESTPKREQRKPTGLDRFDSVLTEKELQKREEDAEHLREWLLQNPEGGDYEDLSGNEHEVDYDTARKLMVDTDRDLRKNIPAVRERITQRNANIQLANATFEWMKDPASIENTELKSVLDQNQYLKDYYDKDPLSSIMVGYAIEGVKAVNARLAAKKKTATQAAPKVPSAPTRAKPKAVNTKKNDNRKELLKKAQFSGDIADAASYIESLI